MKRLLRYMRASALESVCAPLFKLLEALFELFVPLVVADIVDRGIGAGDRTFVTGRFVLLVALGLIAFGWWMFRRFESRLAEEL